MSEEPEKKYGQALNAVQLEEISARHAKEHQQFATPSKRTGTFPKGEQCGDLVETLKSESVDLAPFSVTGRRALVAPVEHNGIDHAFSSLARISR